MVLRSSPTLVQAVLLGLLTLAFAAPAPAVQAKPKPTTRAFVEGGRAVAARFVGKPWEQREESLVQEGTSRFLMADREIGAGDYHLVASLSLGRLDGTAASLLLGESHFGLDGRGGTLFVEGPLFGGPTKMIGDASERIEAGTPFVLQVIRDSGALSLRIDGEEVHRQPDPGAPLGPIGLRPWRNEMSVYSFKASGSLVEPVPTRPAEVWSAPVRSDVYTSGEGGYHTYRIPAVVRAKNGDLLAFCEGRKSGSGDSGDIDLLLKRSEDGGSTWSPARVVWDDGSNTCGNPCPVVESGTGAILLLSTHNLGTDREHQIIAGESKGTRTVWLLRSSDHGRTWSEPREITGEAKRADWTWYATGPGAGIQLQRGEHAGRLVIPCDHIEAETRHYYSHVFYSDDRGETWRLGGSTPRHQVNECEVVELADGHLMLNMRNYDRSARHRQVAFSDDGGASWKDQRHDPRLVEPICQASLRRVSWPRGDEPGVILFSNPADPASRVGMTVRASRDDGASWPAARLLHDGGSAYSCLVALPDGEAGCLFEADGYRRIVFARFPVEGLFED